jgi:molybdopterin/thiamine biosynthesis adenylyltransferase
MGEEDQMAAVDIVKQPRILEHPLSDRSHSFTLAYTSVVIVGCGSLGSVSAGILAREGVGRICLIDDDRIEFANLSKQELYDVEDARLGQFKVLAAKEHLQRLNPYIIIEPVIERLSSQNAKQLISEADLVLDGTDNDFSRYAINQACHQQGIP